jgi:hypothetical protein
LRLAVGEPLRIGELVMLRMEHAETFPLEIRWTLGNEAGAVFLSPVDRVGATQQVRGGPNDS